MNGCCRSRWTAELLLIVALVAGSAAAGCRTAPGPEPAIRISGSDTMLPLNRRLAERYMRTHPGAAVRVEGGGTGSGVAALLAGDADLCAASRPFRPDEINALHDEFETIGVRFLLARDALMVFVHPDNPVRSLSFAELRRVFAAETTDWAAFGGDPGPIEVVVRSPTSGTHHFFRDHVLGDGDYSAAATIVARPGDVIAEVATNPEAIGFGGLVGSPSVAVLAIDDVRPSVAAIRDGTYPLARYLSYYAVRPPTGEVERFVDWCSGADGQRVVADSGLVALWADD
jgi:phosphate transport system substrate-binding protein